MTTCFTSGGAATRRLVVLCALGLTLAAGSASADIGYDTLSGHTTGTLRGFATGTVFAEDITLAPAAGRTLVGVRMAAYGTSDYFGDMTMSFAQRAPSDEHPDLSRIFATTTIRVAALGSVVTWIADLPFVETPSRNIWVMWSFGGDLLGRGSQPSIGSDGGVPSVGSTDGNAYALRAGFTDWTALSGERWVMRLDAIPAPPGVALLGLVAIARNRRRS